MAIDPERRGVVIEAFQARIAGDGFERGAGYLFCMSGPGSVKAAGAQARTRRRVIEDGGGGMRHCDVVACTASEAEVLTDF